MQCLQQQVDSRTTVRRKPDPVDATVRAGFRPRRFTRAVDLVVHRDLPHALRADRLEHLVDLCDAVVALGIGRIADMEDEVGLQHLFERGAESRDEHRRQIGNEADCIRKNDAPGARQLDFPHRRIERREQLVGCIRVGAREPIEQGRLAGVGVTDQRDGRNLLPLALLPRGLTLLQHLLDAIVEGLDALADQSAVGFELGFTRSAQADATAALALEMGPAAHETRRHVLQLREFDLQLAFERARALREDVEDQAAAVEHAALQFLFEIAFLAGAQRAVDDDEIGGKRLDALAQFFDLAGPDQEAGIGSLAGGRQHLKYLRAGRTRECTELLDAIGFRGSTEPHTDQDRAFAAGRPFEQCSLPSPGPAQPAGASSSGGKSSSPAGRRTLRAGTIVEIACL